MHDLETDIDGLCELSEQRDLAEDRLSQYRKTLLTGVPVPGDLMADALIVKAFCAKPVAAPPRALVERLAAVRLEDFPSNSLNILCAAKVMQALVAAPDAAFSQSTLLLHYRLLREIHTADAPHWSTGGARAGSGPGGKVSAYATGECGRAIRGFSRNLKDTGRLIRSIGAAARRLRGQLVEHLPAAWRDAERARLDLSLFITLKSSASAIALPLETPSTPAEVETFVSTAGARVHAAMKESAQAFAAAAANIDAWRTREEASGDEQPGGRVRLDRSLGAHLLAMGAVHQAHEQACAALTLFPADPEGFDRWEDLGHLFETAAKGVDGALRPVTNFLSTVLDRELGKARRKGVIWDPAELASAAASYGALLDDWEDERLVDATRYLAESISEDGRFPQCEPMHEYDKSTYTVSPAFITRTLAQLLFHLEPVPVDAALAKRLLRPFREPPNTKTSDCMERATAALALARMHRMLGERINRGVLRHFTCEQPARNPNALSVDALIPTDYGLCASSPNDRVHSVARPQPATLALERMRAHVLGVELPAERFPRLHSLLLYGPPGTGKTQMIEALAKSCEATLVQLSPSDIVMRGEDAIERRARDVFKALSLLSGTVILFDEFDPVLRRRGRKPPLQSNIFSFLTPGMLPKLQRLNEAARKHRCAYTLNTNLIGHLDEAAIRSGRFDLHVGVFAPDLLSRASRLLALAEEWRRAALERELPRDFDERLLTVLRRTSGCGMASLAKKANDILVADSATPRAGRVRHYLLVGDDPDQIEWPKPESRLPKRPPMRPDTAREEYRLWKWIADWDEVLKDPRVTLEVALDAWPRAGS